jgi:hypothetical protein
MTRRFIRNVVPQGADRERAVLFTKARKKLSHASRHADADAVEEVRDTLEKLLAMFSPEDEREADDEDVVDNEDEDDEDERMPSRSPKADPGAAIKAMTANSREDSVQQALRNDPRYRGQHSRSRHVENEHRSSGNAIVDGMTEHRGDDAVLRGIANARNSRKGR